MNSINLYSSMPMKNMYAANQNFGNKFVTNSNVSASVSFKSAPNLKNIQTVLELASLKGGSRFSFSEIEGLISTLRNYFTELPKDTLVETLLSIGSEKGKPLTAKEIKSFLQVTSELSPKEQENVIRFARAINEKDYPKYDVKYIKENHTFDFYQRTVVNRYDWLKKLPIDEQEQHYKNTLSQELRAANDKHTRDLFALKEYSSEDFISVPKIDFVKNSIAKSNNPEALANVVSQLGITPNTTYASNALVTAYERSGGNVGLIEDLNRCFYPAELIQIANKAESFPKDYVPVSVIQIFEHITPEKIGLSSARKKILKNLGLDGKVKLLPIKRREYIDVYQSGARITGNFEQGRKR